MEKKSVELKDSLRPVLGGGLNKLGESELQTSKTVWTNFTHEMSGDVTNAMDSSRDSSLSLVSIEQFSRFAEVVSGSFKIEVNTRSDRK
jgi:hypothetical protein